MAGVVMPPVVEAAPPRSTPRPVLRSFPGGAFARNAAIVALFFALYAPFTPRLAVALDPLTGDEPFYVMTALSILRDGDIDERNNYARRDYDSFYPPDPLPAGWRGWPAFPRDLPPHPAHSAREGLYSKHGLGVVLLILGPYALGGRLATMLFLNFVAALVALNMALLARRYLGRRGWWWSLALAAALALSNPLMSYAYLIFPEVFAALAIVYTFRRARERENTAAQWLGAGCALALLPWLHARFVPAVLALALLLLPGLRREPRWRRRAAFAVPPAIGAAGLLAYYLYVYGKPLPDTNDHAGFNDLAGTINGFFGLFLDEQWGLLIYTPLYLLAAVGFGTLWRRCRGDARALLLTVTPYVLLVAFYRVWWGEWGPPARYLAPVAPLAVAPLACWIGQARAGVGAIVAALGALLGLVAMAGFLAAPQLMYNHPDGHSALFTAWAMRFGVGPLPKVIPSFQFYSPSPTFMRAAWSVGLAWVVSVGFLWRLFAAGEPADVDATADDN